MFTPSLEALLEEVLRIETAIKPIDSVILPSVVHEPPRSFLPLGHVDKIQRRADNLVISGWAIQDTGEAAARIMVKVDEEEYEFNQFERKALADV